MSLTPPSGRPAFDGCAAYYEAEIAPYLASKERARRAAATNYKILLGSVGAFAAAMLAFGPFGVANIHVAIFAFLIALGVATWLLNRAREDIAHGLLERVCARLGFRYSLKPGRPDYYQTFRTLTLLPNHNREAWEDEVRGEHAGAAFTMCEAHLKYKSSGKRSSTRTVFHGQLLVIDYPRRFLGTTVVKRDYGVFNGFIRPGRDFSNVGLASAEFEKAFEAWSTDQVEARDLLDPIVLERFQELERLFEGKALRAAFVDGKLVVAIETGDRLTMGTMFRPLNDAGRVETVLKEFDTIFDLIDVVVARVEGRLGGAFTLDAVRGGNASS